jgi:hypothetical protein
VIWSWKFLDPKAQADGDPCVATLQIGLNSRNRIIYLQSWKSLDKKENCSIFEAIIDATVLFYVMPREKIGRLTAPGKRGILRTNQEQ